MKIVADTNVILRLFVDDHPDQAAAAKALFEEATVIVASTQSICELCWVLKSVYGAHRDDVAKAIVQLLNTGKITLDKPAIEAGLAILRAGGDFADGVIAHEGRGSGGDTFVSFDKKAIKLMHQQGYAAHLISVDRPQTGN